MMKDVMQCNVRREKQNKTFLLIQLVNIIVYAVIVEIAGITSTNKHEKNIMSTMRSGFIQTKNLFYDMSHFNIKMFTFCVPFSF